MKKDRFSISDVEKLYDYSFGISKADVAGAALRVTHLLEYNPVHFLSRSIEKSEESQFKIVDTLTCFARNEQITVITNLLQSDSVKVKLSSITCLELLKDPTALQPLKNLLQNNFESAEIRKKAKIAFEIISKNPQLLINNTIYTLREWDKFQELDLACAELILNREIFDINLEVLIEMLYHSLKELRDFAKATIIRKRKEFKDQLIEILSTGVYNYNEDMFFILSFYKDTRIAKQIIKWLEENESYRYAGAYIALGKIGGKESAMYLSKKIIRNKNHQEELRALIKINNPPTSFLIDQYKNYEQFRRTGAIRLAKILGYLAIKPLMVALQDRYLEIREDASRGLVYLGWLATPSLIELFDSTLDENIKLHISKIFEKTGDKNALPSLLTLIKSGNKKQQISALIAIGKVKDLFSIEILTNVLQTEDTILSLYAAKSLGSQHHLNAIKSLVENIYHPSFKTRLEIITSLSLLQINLGVGERLVTTALIALLKDEIEDVKNKAEQELIYLGSENQTIIKLLKKEKFNQSFSPTLKRVLNEIENWKKKSNDKSIYYELDSTKAKKAFNLNKSIPQLEIPGKITNSIQLSVSAPRTVCPNRNFILDVWAYFDKNKNQILELARESQRDQAMILRTKGPVRVPRDTTLEVQIRIPEFGIDKRDTIYWSGKTGNCNFSIVTPNDLKFGYYLGVANFYVGPLLISKLNFDIEVGENQTIEADITTLNKNISTAFASYASADREKVIGRIQGMLKLLPDLDIFLDVSSLRSGENWNKRLIKEINSRDVLFLFWSSAASKSPYVEMEWRHALSQKGIAGIDPVPLESPQKVPPPPELSSLHFNEWVLAFEK